MEEYGITQIVILVLSIYLFGIVYGVIFIAALIYTVDMILDKIGYQRVILGDLFNTLEPENVNHSGISIFIIEKTQVWRI